MSTTNRKNSVTKKVALSYYQLLQQQAPEAEFFALEDLPLDFVSSEMYVNKSPDFAMIEENILRPTEKFVFVIPEYNGSYPGILKTLIDGCDVKEDFYGKKACLVGISSSQTGNVRGMDHFTDVLNHIKINVLYHKLRIERIEEAVDEKDQIVPEHTIQRMQTQIDELIKF